MSIHALLVLMISVKHVVIARLIAVIQLQTKLLLKYIIAFYLHADSCKDTNATTPLCDCKSTYYMNVDTCTSCANDKC